MFKIKKLKEEINNAAEEANAAVERTEKELKLKRHLAARLRRVQVELDTLSRHRGLR